MLLRRSLSLSFLPFYSAWDPGAIVQPQPERESSSLLTGGVSGSILIDTPRREIPQ